MKKLMIFHYIKDRDGKIVGKSLCRIVNIDSSFVGNGKGGVINSAEYKKLSEILEPSHDGFTVH